MKVFFCKLRKKEKTSKMEIHARRPNEEEKMKICLAFSAGGHQIEMERLMQAFERNDTFFLTMKKVSTQDLTDAYYVKDTMGPTIIHMFLNMLVIVVQSLRVIILERPKVIVSTGADITIPVCYLGRFFGSRVIFVESICRITELSFAGRLIYPISNLFLVQWPRLLKRYPKARYWGQVI